MPSSLPKKDSGDTWPYPAAPFELCTRKLPKFMAHELKPEVKAKKQKQKQKKKCQILSHRRLGVNPRSRANSAFFFCWMICTWGKAKWSGTFSSKENNSSQRIGMHRYTIHHHTQSGLNIASHRISSRALVTTVTSTSCGVSSDTNGSQFGENCNHANHLYRPSSIIHSLSR
ncbi:hypothetical protein F5B19DRAFT_79872 [Rostrohypoxylon terebratum]|nr:hypothetical protein F5B19DRAFT_79872 [Rostrohypoxylon terebratum]